MTVREKATRYIVSNGLNKPNRSRECVYSRRVLYKILREEGINLTQIGRMFNQDHSTVLHGLKEYEFDSKHSDFLEIQDVITTELELDTLEFDVVEKSLEDLVNECDTYMKFKRLKKYLESK